MLHDITIYGRLEAAPRIGDTETRRDTPPSSTSERMAAMTQLIQNPMKQSRVSDCKVSKSSKSQVELPQSNQQ